MQPLASARRPSGHVFSALTFAGVVALAAGSSAGGAGCTLLLDTGDNPQACKIDADCARFPNAACDNAHRLCVRRLPAGAGAGGAGLGGGGGGGGGATCELSFDNQARIPVAGPDGGLRPLPDVGP